MALHTRNSKAIEGFLEGPAGLGGRWVRRRLPRSTRNVSASEIVTRPASELPGRLPIRRVAPSPKPGLWTDLVLAKRAGSRRPAPLERGPVAISYEDAQWWHVGRFDHVFVTDASQGGVRERRFDSEKAAEMSGCLAGVMKRFLAEEATRPKHSLASSRSSRAGRTGLDFVREVSLNALSWRMTCPASRLCSEVFERDAGACDELRPRPHRCCCHPG